MMVAALHLCFERMVARAGGPDAFLQQLAHEKLSLDELLRQLADGGDERGRTEEAAYLRTPEFRKFVNAALGLF